jgi:hypothetical protein
LSLCKTSVSAGIVNVTAGLGGSMRTYRRSHAFSAYPGGVACVEPPSLGPFEAIGTCSPTYLYVPSPSLSRTGGGGGVWRPRHPTRGARIVGSSSSFYRVIQVKARAPFDKGRLVVRRHVHESAHVGVLGRARSRSLGTEGAEALPRWDPSTSCPRWLLNTTCRAPLSRLARG